MKTFVSKSQAPIALELASIKKDYPEIFAKLITYTSLLQVVFIGVEKGKTTFTWTSITAREVDNNIVVTGSIEHPLEEPRSILGIGETVAAQAYVMVHANEIATDPVGVLRGGIVTEERVNGERVGGKISILKIGRSGTKWEQKGECY